MKYLPRTIEPVIEKASKQFKVVMITGMRQVGKSTLLKHLAGTERKFTGLEEYQAEDINKNPPRFFKEHPAPAVIDEIHLAPALFGSLKATVDRSEERGQYWITGSQKLQLMGGVSDRLPGRLLQFELLPLSIYEQEGLGLEQKPYIPTDDVFLKRPLEHKSAYDTWKTIFQGGWPEIYAKETDVQWLLGSILEMYVEKDVKEVCQLDRVSVFEQFLRALATYSGQELEINTLANMAGVSQPTIKRWLSIAMLTGIIYTVPSFSGNIKKQLRKRPRVYMADTGLLVRLLGIRSVEDLIISPYVGRVFETFVVMEIVKSWQHNGTIATMFYFRDSRDGEIDLIIREKGKYHCIEIKSSAYPDYHMTKWIRRFQGYGFPMGTSSIVCMIDQPHYLADGIIAHSIWDI